MKQKWGETSKKNETAVNLAMKTDMPLFDLISKSPDMSKLFVAYGKNIKNSARTSLKHLVHCYDCEKPKDAVIVDLSATFHS